MNKKILIIEDDMMLRESTADFLNEEGYNVYQAENGMEGIQTAIEKLPDLVLCDIAMPKLDGYKVYKTLQENRSTSSIPFIYLTAKTEKEDLRVGMQLGADDYITKPFDYDELQAAIETRLDKYQKLMDKSKDNFSALLDNNLVGVYILKDSKILFHNKKFSKILGYSEEEIISSNFCNLIHNQDKENFNKALRKCKKGIINRFQVDFRILNAEKKYIGVETAGGLTNMQGGNAFLAILSKRFKEGSNDSAFNPITIDKLNQSIDLILKKKEFISNEMAQKLINLVETNSDEKPEGFENPDRLTKREIEVLQLVSHGMTNQEIAEKLNISVRTVDTHKSHLLEKTYSKNTSQLIVYGIKKGIVTIN